METDLDAIIEFKFQNGPQLMFAESNADIVVYGGEAGGGKSFGLLGLPLRHKDNPRYRAVIFRRTTTQITGGDGLWEEACALYPQFRGRMREAHLDCTFPSGARIGFRSLEHEKSKYDHMGKQYCNLSFDEATHFTRSQLLYLFSRNRSICGVRPYIRMTCNPDPASFVAELIAWHIDDDGYAIPERDGVIRYLVIDDEEIYFYDSVELAIEAHPELHLQPDDVLSFTFIHASLSDNPALMEKDPSYRAKLMLLPKIERDRLMGGNWKSREGAIIDTNQLKRFVVAGDNIQLVYHGRVMELPRARFRRFATIDTAGTSKEKAAEKKGDPASWSVCAIWDYYRHKDKLSSFDILCLSHVWRARVGWIELKARIPEVLAAWSVPLAVIENAHYGQPLASEIRGLQTRLVGPMIPGMDDTSRGAKLERAIASGLLSRIEDVGIWIPHNDDANWVRAFVNELAAWTGLPKETADQIDVCSYGAYHVRSLSQVWGGVP